VREGPAPEQFDDVLRAGDAFRPAHGLQRLDVQDAPVAVTEHRIERIGDALGVHLSAVGDDVGLVGFER
jgi:hypothetical protein